MKDINKTKKDIFFYYQLTIWQSNSFKLQIYFEETIFYPKVKSFNNILDKQIRKRMLEKD